jgi:acetolactate synthase I/II/III large subunit
VTAVTKYADALMRWLRDDGYTHCFFVAGGASMHLLDGARQTMTCIPVIHEVAAGIAAEYYNASEGPGRAFALVTAGPGLTNMMTAFAGAWLESRELLVVGGQVKSTDLADGGLRQRGIQEIDGVAMTASVCKASRRLEEPMDRDEVLDLVRLGRDGRPGPIFLEVCLDVQGAPVEIAKLEVVRSTGRADGGATSVVAAAAQEIREVLSSAERPVLLIGAGVSRRAAADLLPRLEELRIPTMTTWNGMDRIPASSSIYAGRPNTWGQRFANVLLQQADAIIALGTRLGLQHTGFNWQAFAPLARVIQVDLDRAELEKGHPTLHAGYAADANEVLGAVVSEDLPTVEPWLEFCGEVRKLLPLAEPWNEHAPGYLDPYEFMLEVSDLCRGDDVIIPCSSGGAETVTMQTFEQKRGQIIVNDKGLASMGYGLSGAIGAAIAHPRRRTMLFEGDGGFAQNLQELATVRVNDLNLKIFVFANEGYASIRMTQRNYFGGAYLGCDTSTGLGFPDWKPLFEAFGIPMFELDTEGLRRPDVQAALESTGPAGFLVPIDPEQTYYPKITSRITASGSMESQPLHLMSPDLPAELAARVFRFLEPEST